MATPNVDDERALAFSRRGLAYLEEGLLDDAERAFRACLELRPGAAEIWFDLGLIYKWRKQWAQALLCNRRAAELAPDDEAAWWNLGTAATALHDWPTARQAWRGFGLTLTDGVGPIEGRFGKTCVRLNPQARSEVVWCRRIDPVRAVVESVPTPESGHRWGDVVLHDGERVGERRVEGRIYPVFNELERWESSTVPTLRVDVEAPSPADVDALGTLLVDAGYGAEDWTDSCEILCKSCSEGVIDLPGPDVATEPQDWRPRREMAIAAPRAEAERLVRWWAGRAPGRYAGEVEVVG